MRGATEFNTESASTHAFQSTLLMRGATHPKMYPVAALTLFQSTLLMRGATVLSLVDSGYQLISIHAPHARSDLLEQHVETVNDISIHAPHARSDCIPTQARWESVISIHAPHARSDRALFTSMNTRLDFNPRSSCEERLAVHFVDRACFIVYFNPRSSCEERQNRRIPQ